MVGVDLSSIKVVMKDMELGLTAGSSATAGDKATSIRTLDRVPLRDKGSGQTSIAWIDRQNIIADVGDSLPSGTVWDLLNRWQLSSFRSSLGLFQFRQFHKERSSCRGAVPTNHSQW